jgi:hypothetical protein
MEKRAPRIEGQKVGGERTQKKNQFDPTGKKRGKKKGPLLIRKEI